jgi:hypothetical protein
MTNKHWRTGSGLFSDISSRGELSYLAPVGSENISAPYFKQCFFQGTLPSIKISVGVFMADIIFILLSLLLCL